MESKKGIPRNISACRELRLTDQTGRSSMAETRGHGSKPTLPNSTPHRKDKVLPFTGGKGVLWL